MTLKDRIFIISFFAVCFGSNAQTPTGLVSHWSFDGHAVDSMGSNHGEIFGNVRPAVGIDGMDSTALFFDGTDDYIKILTPQSSEMTIMFWMKPHDLQDDDRIISSLDGTTNSFSLKYIGAGIQLRQPLNYIVAFFPDQSLWYFIAITISSSGATIGYLNGAPQYQQSFTIGESTYWGLGRKHLNTQGNDFHGALDEISIYDRVLTAGEIESAYMEHNPNANGNFCNTLFWTEEKVGIGTASPDMELTVNGKIHARGVKVDPEIPVPDYVFEPDYSLRSLEDLSEYIKANRHLPEIQPAEKFQQEGLKLGEMDLKLLLKIEELTLYVIEQRKRIESLLAVKQTKEVEKRKLESLARRIEEMENLIKKK